jgi:neutral ceramidase
MKALAAILISVAGLSGASLKAGAGRVDITPAGSIWMSGYAARTHPSEGTLTPLWAKALAIESGPGGRIVIVSSDVVGVPLAVVDEVAARVKKEHGLKRSQFLINASHTHTGPVVWPNLENLAVFPPAEKEKLLVYQRKFIDALVTAIGDAIRDLAPATVEYGEGSVGFAINRRQTTPAGVKIGVDPNGPVDHTVPVLRITGADGKLRAALFGYACHNTTLTGETYQLSGDYAGFAAAELERQHPGATALFLMLCGADQNPNPRGTVELARKYGEALAAEVDRVISGRMTPVAGPIRTAFRLTPLQLAPRTRLDFETELTSSLPAEVRRAQMMLKILDAGGTIDRIEYPVQAVRFGRGLTLVALGGEVTVDYSLRLKREYTGEPMIVAGYSNDVMCYIPSARVLKEGGYEAKDSMIYYGQAGPFSEDVEERILAAVHLVMKDVRR